MSSSLDQSDESLVADHEAYALRADRERGNDQRDDEVPATHTWNDSSRAWRFQPCEGSQSAALSVPRFRST